MGSSITQPIRKFFSRDKGQQKPLTRNEDSPEEKSNPSEPLDDDSAHSINRESDISSGISTSSILSSEDEGQPKTDNMPSGSNEITNEVKQKNCSEKEDSLLNIDENLNKGVEKEFGVKSDESENKNMDSRPNIFDLRYKLNNSKYNKSDDTEKNDSNLDKTLSSDERIFESEPFLPSVHKAETENIPQTTNSETQDLKQSISQTVFSDAIVQSNSPENNSKLTSKGNLKNNSALQNGFGNPPLGTGEEIWMDNQVVKKAHVPTNYNNTSRNDEHMTKYGYSNNSSILEKDPPFNDSLFTKTKPLSSNLNIKNKVIATTINSENVTLDKEAELFNQSKSNRTINATSTLYEQKHINDNKSMYFQNMNILPGGRDTMQKKYNKRTTYTHQVKNSWKKRPHDKKGYLKSKENLCLDVSKLKYLMSVPNILENPLYYRSNTINPISTSTFESKMTEWEGM